MKILYPNDPFKPSAPDEAYAEEHFAASELGIETGLISFEELQISVLKVRPQINEGDKILFRGWMMEPKEYQAFSNLIINQGASLITSPDNYLLTHYLPEWYPLLSDSTPETFFFSEDDNMASMLKEKGWSGCFLKDFVKSVSTDGGSRANNLDKVPSILEKMKKYRGKIEGGISARRLVDLVESSENRFFVVSGTPYHPSEPIPSIVHTASQKIDSPFFSVDTAQTIDGEDIIIELGDGQVSDRKEWSAQDFTTLLRNVEQHG